MRDGGNRGFTLVELLVCLAIIGLLCGIVFVPAIDRLLDHSIDVSLISLTREMQQVGLLAVLDSKTYVLKVHSFGYDICLGESGSKALSSAAWPDSIRLDTTFAAGTVTQISFYPSGKCVVSPLKAENCIHFKTSRGQLRVVMVGSDGSFTWK